MVTRSQTTVVSRICHLSGETTSSTTPNNLTAIATLPDSVSSSSVRHPCFFCGRLSCICLTSERIPITGKITVRPLMGACTAVQGHRPSRYEAVPKTVTAVLMQP
jgi:hypothetical protein